MICGWKLKNGKIIIMKCSGRDVSKNSNTQKVKGDLSSRRGDVVTVISNINQNASFRILAVMLTIGDISGDLSCSISGDLSPAQRDRGDGLTSLKT